MDVEYGYLYYQDGNVILENSTNLQNKLILGQNSQIFYGGKIGIGDVPDLNESYLFQLQSNVLFNKTHSLYRDSIYQDNFSSKVTCSPCNIILTYDDKEFNTKIDTLGVLENKLVITDYVRVHGKKLENVHVQSFYRIDNSNLYNIIIDNSYANNFTENNMFLIDDMKFVIERKEVNTNCNMHLTVSSLLPEQNYKETFPVKSDSYVDFQMLKNINPQSIPETPDIVDNNAIFISVVITSNDSNTLFCEVDDNRSDGFRVGGYYNIKLSPMSESAIEETPTNIFVLKQKERLQGTYVNDVSKLSLTFETPDPTEDPLNYLDIILSKFDTTDKISAYLFPLDIYLDSGKYNASPFIDLSIQEGHVGENEVTVSYVFTSENTHIFEYLLNKQTRQHYIEEYVYILDSAAQKSRIWYIDRFEISEKNKGKIYLQGLIPDDSSELLEQPRNVKVLFFRLSIYNRFGDGIYPNYFPFNTKICMGTTNLSEFLTVGGDLSCQESFYLYGSNDTFDVHIMPSNGAMFGSYMTMCNDEVNVNKLCKFEEPVNFAKNISVDSSFFGKSVSADILHGEGLLLSLGKYKIKDVEDVETPYVYKIPVRYLSDELISGRYLGLPPYHFCEIKSVKYDPPDKAVLTLLEPGISDLSSDDLILYTTKTDGHKEEDSTVHLESRISSVETIDEKRIKVEIENPKNKDFLLVGRIFSFLKESTRPLLLTQLSEYSYNKYILTLKSIDNLKLDEQLNLKTDSNDIIPLDTIYQPRYNQFPEFENAPKGYPYEKIIEKDLMVSFRVTVEGVDIVLQGASKLLELCNSEFFISCINKIYLSIGTYEIEGIKRLDKRVILRTKHVKSNYMKTYTNATAAYALNGFPIKLLDTQFDGEQTWIPTFEFQNATIAELFETYKGNYVYIMDYKNSVWYIHATHLFDNYKVTMAMTPVNNSFINDVSDRIKLSTERHVFIVPFKYFNKSVYKDKPVSINTNFSREMLTVNGNMSCENKCRLYDKQFSLHPFELNYSNDVLHLGDVMKLSSSNIQMNVPSVNIDGDVYATRFLNSSDRRLKSNIKDVDYEDSLKRLCQLQLKEFDMCNMRQRGFIAQDVQKVFPEFVHEREGIIPWDKEKDARLNNTTLYFKDGTFIEKPKNLVFEKITDGSFCQIKIIGTRELHLVVDQSSLFATALGIMCNKFSMLN